MAAAGAIRRRHLPDGCIQWLLSKAPDVIHRAMHPASYRLTRIAIKIASNLPAFLVVVDSFFAHNLSLRPCYGHHKLKSSYIIVHIVLINLFVYYWLPLSMTDAVSATIFDGGRAIRQKHKCRNN
jgi:hypothetical protein